ncbi:MAG: hypothetical protein AB1758_30230 [Candidatus Eremiobacterota bacterium]
MNRPVSGPAGQRYALLAPAGPVMHEKREAPARRVRRWNASDGFVGRLILDPPREGGLNMALDELLLEESDGPVLRLYSWTRPTLSLGRFQRFQPRLPIAVVRRPSGGRAVLHGQEITYCFVSFHGRETVRESFCRVARSLAAALRRLGIPADTCAADSISPSRTSPACFAVARQGEVQSRGRKLVGSAQVRSGPRTLQHGTLPLRLDRALARELFGTVPECTDLAELGFGDLDAERLAAVWVEELGLAMEPAPWTPQELERGRNRSGALENSGVP